MWEMTPQAVVGGLQKHFSNIILEAMIVKTSLWREKLQQLYESGTTTENLNDPAIKLVQRLQKVLIAQ